MGARFTKERYPKWSLKWLEPSTAVKKIFRRRVRARQLEAMRNDPDGTTVKEEKKIGLWETWLP